MTKSQLWSKLTLWLTLWAFSAALLMIASWNSYLHDIYPHYDTPWFFMCGKAWMNGLTPYVDFSDSKGPLLWLIYGLGYLISPRDYTGAYWISTIIFTIAFFYAYKSALLITGNRATAVLATAVIAFVLTVKWIHDETRCEDYCCAVTMPVIYYFVRCTFATSSDDALVRKVALALGACLGITILIKYNIAVMLAIAVPYFGWIVPHRLNYSPWRALMWIIVGILAVTAPFAIIFTAQGCFGEFINEYFFVTAKTISNIQSSDTIGHKISFLLKTPSVLLFLSLIIVLVVIAAWKKPAWRWPLVIAFIWFGAIIAMNLKAPFYLQPLAPLAMPGIAVAVKPLNNILRLWQWKLITATGMTALLVWGSNKTAFYNMQETTTQRVFYYYAALEAQYKQPHIIYLNCHDLGSGVSADALPGCKYWSKQTGATPQMLEETHNAIKQHKADVVIVRTYDELERQMLDSLGYYCYTSQGAGVEYFERTLYSRLPLDTVKAAEFHITPNDILTKRRLFP